MGLVKIIAPNAQGLRDNERPVLKSLCSCFDTLFLMDVFILKFLLLIYRPLQSDYSNSCMTR